MLLVCTNLVLTDRLRFAALDFKNTPTTNAIILLRAKQNMSRYNYEDLPVKQVRHYLDISQDGLHQICNENRVAIHWADIRSRQAEDYIDKVSEDDVESATSDIEEFNKLDETGGIVLADYSSDYGSRKGIHKSKLFLGVVPPGSFEYKEYPKTSGDTGIYKTLQFDTDTVQEIFLADRPDIFSDKPARGTIQTCDKTETRLRNLADPERMVSEVGPQHLSHDQFEHVCVQYLSLIKYPGRFYTVQPVGGEDNQLPLIDINAGVEETEVVAQVTTAIGENKVKSKVEDLAGEFSEETEVYFFGPQKYRDELNQAFDEIEYIGDQTVFDELSSNPKTEHMMDRILRVT